MKRFSTIAALVATVGGLLTCSGRAALHPDASAEATAPTDVGPVSSSDGQLDSVTDVEAGDRPELDATMDGSPATAVDAAGATCSLACPGGACPTRAGSAPVVVAKTAVVLEHIASVAVGGGRAYVGTISSTTWVLGRLFVLTMATGETSVLDPEVQASEIKLVDDTLFYVGDAVQSPAQTLWSVSTSGGARALVTADDRALVGYVARSADIFYELGYEIGSSSFAYIWRDHVSDSTRVVDVVGAPHGLAVDDQNVYFTAGDGPSTLVSHRWVEFGTTSLPLTTADDALAMPLVAGVDLYFVHQHAAGDCGGSVATMPTTGGPPRQVSLGDSGSDVSSLAVDDAFVYWTTFDDGGVVFRAPRAGGTPEILAAGQREARGVTFDETRVYWIVTDATGGQVRAVAK